MRLCILLLCAFRLAQAARFEINGTVTFADIGAFGVPDYSKIGVMWNGLIVTNGACNPCSLGGGDLVVDIPLLYQSGRTTDTTYYISKAVFDPDLLTLEFQGGTFLEANFFYANRPLAEMFGTGSATRTFIFDSGPVAYGVYTISPVPEPGSFGITLTILGGLILFARLRGPRQLFHRIRYGSIF